MDDQIETFRVDYMELLNKEQRFREALEIGQPLLIQKPEEQLFRMKGELVTTRTFMDSTRACLERSPKVIFK